MRDRINIVWPVKAQSVTSAQNVAELLLKLSIRSTSDRQVSEEDIRIVLQSHAEGSSLRGISRISGLAYDTVVSIVQAAAHKAQIVHNAEVQDVDTDAIAADELWSFVEKNIHHCLPDELEGGDCWIALSLARVEWVDSLRSCRQAHRRGARRS